MNVCVPDLAGDVTSSGDLITYVEGRAASRPAATAS
jgi:hypothetical protein